MVNKQKGEMTIRTYNRETNQLPATLYPRDQRLRFPIFNGISHLLSVFFPYTLFVFHHELRPAVECVCMEQWPIQLYRLSIYSNLYSRAYQLLIIIIINNTKGGSTTAAVEQ